MRVATVREKRIYAREAERIFTKGFGLNLARSYGWAEEHLRALDRREPEWQVFCVATVGQECDYAHMTE